MQVLGGAINEVAGRFLRGSSALQAVFLSINGETPTPELITNHIDGSALIIDPIKHPYCPGSLTLAMVELAHPMPESFLVTRHEYVLAGDLTTRRIRAEDLQQSIRKQLRMIRDYRMELIDYDPIDRLPLAEDRVDEDLDGLRRSFSSFIHHLE